LVKLKVNKYMESFEKFFKKVNNDINYDPKQLKMGIAVEKEHTTNSKIAETIAKHHLEEDPEYYTKLKSLKL